MVADPVDSTCRLEGVRSLAVADSIPGAEESRTDREEDRRHQGGRCSSQRLRREEATVRNQQVPLEGDSRDQHPDALVEGTRADRLAVYGFIVSCLVPRYVLFKVSGTRYFCA